LEIGKPVFNKVKKDIEKDKSNIVSSECPLAADHIKQGVRLLNNDSEPLTKHPIELIAESYNLKVG